MSVNHSPDFSVPTRLSRRCRLVSHSSWFARLRFAGSHLTISGWSASGYWSRVVHLFEIMDVEWWSGTEDTNLVVRLHSAEEFAFVVAAPGLWKFTLDARTRFLTQSGDGDSVASEAVETDLSPVIAEPVSTGDGSPETIADTSGDADPIKKQTGRSSRSRRVKKA